MANPPLFNWDTLPVFMHAAPGLPGTHVFNLTEIAFMARFPMVTLAGSQRPVSVSVSVSVSVTDLATALKAAGAIKRANTTTKAPCLPCHAFVKDAATCQQITYNWTGCPLPLTVECTGILQSWRELLESPDGDLVKMNVCGGTRGGTDTVFDHSNAAMHDLWAASAVGAVASSGGLLDGVFADRGRSRLEASFSCLTFPSGKPAAWEHGHMQQALADAFAGINATTSGSGILISNGAEPDASMGLKGNSTWNGRMFEDWDRPYEADYIPAGQQLPVLQKDSAKGMIAQ
eukprot:gene3274-3784_t